ncbi:type III secretion system chaperone [Devosia sp. ZB163]|uniref:type III secretion system chaperone n=1 Tax=Devosia sp. ZB163 TaxID=3025938 RepID=UPI002362ACAA|nr:type III secretion system chaperone [Devosia sp. ZB163]MDC9822999.1 type III secretion system chaperone [Devosia sp. ZB163]
MSEHLKRLIGEIGPALDLEAVLQVAEGREWELVLAEGLSLRLEYEPSDDRLTLTGDIAPLGPSPSPDLLIQMLQYNSASTQTGGVRLALDADLTAQQIYDTPAAGLALSDLKTIVLGLADKIVAWQGALAGDPKPAPGEAPVASMDAYVFKI